MRYAIEQYDNNGFLKAPIWLWLGWIFLAKAWVVFVVAGASRESGSQILTIVYPDHTMLYLGLIMGVPSIVLMWLISLRNPQRRWVNKLVSWGKGLTLVTALAQLGQTLYHVHLQLGAFSWANAATLVILSWFVLYLSKSKTVRDCLVTPALE